MQVNNDNALAFSPTGGSTLGPDLDKQAFLQLLVTQMRFQDPLNPVENQEFVAQLAQFSSLESLSNIGLQMETANLLQQSAHNALSTALIGKYTLTAGNTLEVDGESIGSVVYYAPENTDAQIRIVDDAGNVVRTIIREGVDEGEHLVEWDGLDDEGEVVADGNYHVEVESSLGEELGVFKAGKVQAVRFIGGSPILVIDGQEHRMADIIEVMENLPEV